MTLRSPKQKSAKTDLHNHLTFWAFLNSPFAIWLFSASLVTLGGAYISSNRQCVAEAESVIESVSKLDAEISMRQRFMIRAVVSAKNPEELKAAIAAQTPLYAEFASRTLFELIDEKTRLTRKMDFGADSEFERSQNKWDSILARVCTQIND